MKARKVISLITVFAMLLTVFQFSIPAQAAEPEIQFKYVIYTTSSTQTDSKTSNGNLTGKIYFFDGNQTPDKGGTISFSINNTNVTGKEGSGKSDLTARPPWTVSSYELYNASKKDAYKCNHMKLYVETYKDGNRINSHQIGNTYYPEGNISDQHGIKIENSKEFDSSIKVKVGDGEGPQTRDVKIITDWEKFGGKTYLNPNGKDSGSISLVLPGTVTDRYTEASLFGSGKKMYNVYDYAQPPVMKMTIKGVTKSGESVTMEKLTEGGNSAIAKKQSKNDNFNGIVIDKKKLVSYMNKKGVNMIEITTSISFPSATFSHIHTKDKVEYGRDHAESDKYTLKYKIYRSAFEICRIHYRVPGSETLFQRSTDNYYYNNNNSKIVLYPDVTYINNDNNNEFAHFTSSYLDGKTIKFDAWLQLGDDTENLIKSNSNTATIDQWSDFKLEFNIPEGRDSNNQGITLILENAYIDNPDGTDYHLTEYGEDYSGTTGLPLGSTSMYSGAYKVDALNPEMDFEFIDSADNPEVNGWRRKAVLRTTPSETLWSSRGEGTFSYKLTDKYSGVTYPITDMRGNVQAMSQSTSAWADASEGRTSEIVIASNTDNQEIEGVLTVTDTTDVGNNKLAATFDGIKLDNQPPRVNISEEAQARAADNTKSTTFNFKVEDASGSARVYYTFTEGSASTAPAFDPEASESLPTGEINAEEMLGKWAFVSQIPDDDSASYDRTDGLALLKAQAGAIFTGKLHYFTEDGLGNRSDITSRDVQIYNETTQCDITTDGDSSVPLKDYIINISSPGNTIQWRWTYPDSGAIAAFKPYRTAAEVGRGTQSDDNGNKIVLDGEYILEVLVTTGSGTAETYRRTFVFDNSEPDIGFVNTQTGTFRGSQQITVNANDVSGIVSATAQIVKADGTGIEGLEPFELSINGSALKDYVTITDVTSGSYAVKVTVQDGNGFEATELSNPIYIRNAAPQLEISIESDKTREDAPLFNENSYKLNVSVREEFEGAEIPQILHYRVANSTQQYGDWYGAGETRSDESGYYAQVEIDTPLLLREDLNTIYVQTLLAPEGVKPENIESQPIVATASTDVYYDSNSPKYRLELEDRHSGDSISGVLALEDSSEGEIVVDTSSVSADALTLEAADAVNVYNITVKENLDNAVITAKDVAGNVTEIPINITGIDKTAPVVEYGAPVPVISGERTSAKLKLYIYDVDTSTVEFALIPEAEMENATDENGNIDDSYFKSVFTNEEAGNAGASEEDDATSLRTVLQKEEPGRFTGEYNATYDISLSGTTGTFYVGVRMADSVENKADVILDAPLVTADAEAEVTGYEVNPREASGYAKVTVDFNVPVSVLDQKLIKTVAESGLTLDETNLEYAQLYGSSFSAKAEFIISKTGKYKLYAVDELDRKSVHEIEITEEDVIFGSTLEIESQTIVVTTRRTWDFDAMDYIYEELDRVVIPEDEYTFPLDIYIDDSGDVYKTSLIEVTAPAGKYLQPVEEAGDYDVYEHNRDALRFEPDYSRDYLAEPYGYTKMYYSAGLIAEDVIDEETGDGYMSILDKNQRTLDVYLLTEETVDNPETWSIATAYINNIDNTAPEATVRVSPDTVRDDDYLPTKYTLGEVTAEISLSDPHSGIAYVVFDGQDVENWDVLFSVTIPFEDEDGKGIAYESGTVVLDNEYVTITITADDDIKAEKFMGVVFKQNIIPMISPFNTVGGLGSVTSDGFDDGIFRIDYIIRKELSQEDYTVSYYYEDYKGEWLPVEEGSFYKNAKAVITPTASGLERGLYSANNGGSFEKLLNSFAPSYTFNLKDKYGYSTDVYVELTNYDETPGNISYLFSTTGKTNQPVDLFISVADEQSGVGTVTLTREGTDIPLSESEGSYTTQIDSVGNYIITLYDMAGNKTQEILSVTQIDSNAPAVATVAYSVEEPQTSSKPITARIYYTKPGVRLTKVETDGYLTADDYSVDYNNSILRFAKNGTLSIWFEDEYGNEASDTVAVSNIFTDPPAVDAVAEYSADTMSVDVTFAKTVDPDTLVPVDTVRELTDLTVVYGGMSRRIESFDDEGNIVQAKYTFRENGDYTFEIFDDEGLTSYIRLTIDKIDTTAPVITQVKWSYEYDVYEGDEWVTKTMEDSLTIGTDTPGTEAGYIIATDVYPVTNRNVDVTVVTDADTRVMGTEGSEYTTENKLTYFENGMYIFNLEKRNKLSDSYGVDIELIDKTAPVIELAAPELIFYENPAYQTTPYDEKLINEIGTAYVAYDMFGGRTDLSHKVEIDYGTFDKDNIANNTFDRTKPYTITYSVYDNAGNRTEVPLNITLVGLTDTVALVNGSFPDYAGRSNIDTRDIVVSLENFSGISYAKIEKGVKTLGEMKTAGSVLKAEEGKPGTYKTTVTEDGWYTVLVQTDKRDYFNLQIFVFGS